MLRSDAIIWRALDSLSCSYYDEDIGIHSSNLLA